LKFIQTSWFDNEKNLAFRLPKFIGHRGAAGYAPENTLASIHKAARIGASWVEFDVQLTYDSELVLFHDNSLDRTTNGKGLLAGQCLKSLKELDAGSWFGSDFTGETVPTLNQALSTAGELDLGCNVEIKSSFGRERETVRAFARTIVNFPKSPTILVSSFCHETVQMLKHYLPEVRRALIVHEIPANWQSLIKRMQCSSLHVSEESLDQSQVQMVQSTGIRVLAFTINDRKRAENLFAMGVSSIFTDFPGKIFSPRTMAV